MSERNNMGDPLTGPGSSPPVEPASGLAASHSIPIAGQRPTVSELEALLCSGAEVDIVILPDGSIRGIESSPAIPWPDPSPAMLIGDVLFDAIWSAIKKWDVHVPGAYSGYCGATGNHARAIYDSITAQGIEAQRAETQSGSVHESPVGNADAPDPYMEAIGSGCYPLPDAPNGGTP